MSTSDQKKSPEQVAEDILSDYWNEDDFPVDPVAIAKKLGIEVLKSKLPEKVSGVIYKKQNQNPIIFLHEPDSIQRKRFTCAHELGHYYIEIDKKQFEYVDLRENELNTSGTNSNEIFANQFAACLLMPETEMKNVYKKLSKIRLLKHFGVSGEAMKWRLKNLGLKHNEFQEND